MGLEEGSHHEGIHQLFEEIWVPHASDEAFVLDFLLSIGRGDLSDSTLLAELIQMDIERAWLHWCQKLESDHRVSPPEQLVSRHKGLPQVSAYLSLLHTNSQCFAKLAEIAAHECHVRDALGDAIGPLHYRSLYGIDIQENDNHRPRTVLRDDRKRGLGAFEAFPLRGLTRIGRQRSRDAHDYFCEVLPPGNRIVIAPRREKRVSRDHLAIQLLTPEFAIVTNSSLFDPVLVDGELALVPAESACLRFPFFVELPHDRLWFT